MGHSLETSASREGPFYLTINIAFPVLRGPFLIPFGSKKCGTLLDTIFGKYPIGYLISPYRVNNSWVSYDVTKVMGGQL
jgi:hypothetical protein